MAGSIGTRGIRLGGRDWQLAGPAEDSFFAHADGHAAGMEALAAVAASVLPPDGMVLDVGANIGLSALALAPLLPRGRILALEPSPRTVAALRRTLALNGLEDRVAVEAVAVGATAGEAAFHAAEHSAGAHLMDPGMLGAAAPAAGPRPVETLDALVAAARACTGWISSRSMSRASRPRCWMARARTLARHRPLVFAEFNAWTLQCNRSANPRAVLEDWLRASPWRMRCAGRRRRCGSRRRRCSASCTTTWCCAVAPTSWCWVTTRLGAWRRPAPGDL